LVSLRKDQLIGKTKISLSNYFVGYIAGGFIRCCLVVLFSSIVELFLTADLDKKE